MKEGLKKDTLLNVNVPNLPDDQIKGVKVTRQGRREYSGSVLERIDPRGKKYYWIGGIIEDWIPAPEADHQAVSEGYISVTPLKLDLTDHDAVSVLRAWEGL